MHDAGCYFAILCRGYDWPRTIFFASFTENTHKSRTAWPPPKYSVQYHII